MSSNIKALQVANGLLETILAGTYHILHKLKGHHFEALGPFALIFLPLLDLAKAFLYWSKHKETNYSGNYSALTQTLHVFKFFASSIGFALLMLGMVTLGFALLVGANAYMTLRYGYKMILDLANWRINYLNGDNTKEIKAQLLKHTAKFLMSACYTIAFGLIAFSPATLTIAPILGVSFAIVGTIIGLGLYGKELMQNFTTWIGSSSMKKATQSQVGSLPSTSNPARPSSTTVPGSVPVSPSTSGAAETGSARSDSSLHDSPLPSPVSSSAYSNRKSCANEASRISPFTAITILCAREDHLLREYSDLYRQYEETSDVNEKRNLALRLVNIHKELIEIQNSINMRAPTPSFSHAAPHPSSIVSSPMGNSKPPLTFHQRRRNAEIQVYREEKRLSAANS